jgi:hypothetical protein
MTRVKLWRRWDRGLLLALLIGAIAAWPFWANPSLPLATDAELHIFRIAEIGHSLRAGNLYPRWAANFYYGYGYPIFNYYAPLTYHLGNWMTLFQPEWAVAGAKMLFIAAALLGAAGAYLLGRDFGGQGGGVLGAATFACSPIFCSSIRTCAATCLKSSRWHLSPGRFGAGNAFGGMAGEASLCCRLRRRRSPS